MNVAATHHVRVPRRVVAREPEILKRCAGRKVLHLGCADAPFLTERIRTNTWLHPRIVGVAESCVGIDLDAESVATIRRTSAVDVRVGDAEQLPPELGQFDVVVAGELLEHLNRPGSFLESVRGVLAPHGELVITTPNAFCLRRFVRVAMGIESVHPDHVAYYSHSTLSELLRRYHFRVTVAANYGLPVEGSRAHYLLERAISVIAPALVEGLFYVVSAEEATS